MIIVSYSLELLKNGIIAMKSAIAPVKILGDWAAQQPRSPHPY
jgi:hypothetical protein